MKSEAYTIVHLPDVIVVRLALQMVKHPEASGHLRVFDGTAVVEVKLEGGRISVLVLEGREKGALPCQFSVLDLRTAQVFVMGKAYRTWLEIQAEQYGLREPLWE